MQKVNLECIKALYSVDFLWYACRLNPMAMKQYWGKQIKLHHRLHDELSFKLRHPIEWEEAFIMSHTWKRVLNNVKLHKPQNNTNKINFIKHWEESEPEYLGSMFRSQVFGEQQPRAARPQLTMLNGQTCYAEDWAQNPAHAQSVLYNLSTTPDPKVIFFTSFIIWKMAKFHLDYNYFQVFTEVHCLFWFSPQIVKYWLIKFKTMNWSHPS